ncbi:hypothetical protein SK128_012312 [Halocaridina rubra]|uniref:Ig-like domain-containing protein n=1 Tax=Halocaridina rubra TaxID=373956 RepID=A0AAN8WUA9_HALRR
MGNNISVFEAIPGGFDDRALARGKQSHWADDDQLGSRARLDVSSSPALLRLSKLTMADQGLYRCRVDFKFQPTKTTRISLTVVVPPKGLSIVVDGPGAASRPVSRVVGPYLEGDTIALTCIAHGGNPPAKVVWYEDGLTLDRNMESEIPEIETDIPEMFLNTTGSSWPTKVWPTAQVPFMVPSGTSDEEGGGGGEPYNTVVLGPLTRSDLKRVLTCEGTNNNITLPLSLVVNLDMNCKYRFC